MLRLFLISSLVALAAASDTFVQLDTLDCWRGNVIMPNNQRYLGHAGIVSVEECNQACNEKEGCDVVYQYRYEYEGQPGSCFLLSKDNCVQAETPQTDVVGWHTRVRNTIHPPTDDTPAKQSS